jgi:hypothetical protein
MSFDPSKAFPTPVPKLEPNTFAFEQLPMVKPTGFRLHPGDQRELDRGGVGAKVMAGDDVGAHAALMDAGGGAAGEGYRARALADGLFRPVRPRLPLRGHGHRLA